MFGIIRKTIDGVAEQAARDRLRERIQRLIDKWEPILGVHVHSWNLRKMRTYWAGTNSATKTISFDSRQLGDMSHAFLEVTVVHELMHLRVPEHTKRFYELMDHYLPKWRRLHAKHAGKMTPQS